MERVGKHFEFGYPSVQTKGVSYSYPNNERDWNKRLIGAREELGDLLIDRLRGYITEFDVFTLTPHYPYVQKGEKGLTLHLGGGGRWIEVWDFMQLYFIGTHNLDSYKDRVAAFNIGSDTLEHLDPTILAPRIRVEDGKYVMRYPLPKGLELITNPRLTEEVLNRVYGAAKLKQDVSITNEDKRQEIKNSDGVIVIEGGVCEGRNFEKWNIPKASWAISLVMSLCEPKKS